MPTTPLGTRLRELRTQGWSGVPVTQMRVAEAIGVAAPSVSAYENGVRPPSPVQLQQYAVLFASPRWSESSGPLHGGTSVLTDSELRTYEDLLEELMRLRELVDPGTAPDASSGRPRFWHFGDDAPIRIICGRLPPDEAGPYGDPDEHNHMALRNAADLDSLVELWGHLREQNPDSDVRYRLGRDFSTEDLQGHVVVLGNIALMQGGELLLPEASLPIRQVAVEDLDGEVFEVDTEAGGQRFGPVLRDGRVVEDVGLVARIPSPFRAGRTLTICSGVFTRGVYGAVRSLTDRELGTSNADCLRRTFPDPSSFAILLRVLVAGDNVATPDLLTPRTRLLEIADLSPTPRAAHPD